MAAAVEQHHDEQGIVWPAAIAPYDVHVLSLSGGSAEVAEAAEQVASELDGEDQDVLLDDRDARPGEKFADADLIGCPRRVTVGRKTLEDGAVDARRRADGADARVARGNLANWMEES